MSSSQMLLFLLSVLLLSSSSFAEYGLSTCARMDDGLLSKVARAQCIASCSVQNCGTGYCERRGGRPTCVCSRCANGGNVPIDALINKGK